MGAGICEVVLIMPVKPFNVDDQPWMIKGQRVCIKGKGTDAVLHVHTTIFRVTNTMIICRNGRRFSRIPPYRSVPRSTWGGSYVSSECQAPEEV